MGETLISETIEDAADIEKLRLRNHHLWKKVDAVLAEQMKRVTKLIQDNRSIIDVLTKHLVERKSMSGPEIERFFYENRFQLDQTDIQNPSAKADTGASQ